MHTKLHNDKETKVGITSIRDLGAAEKVTKNGRSTATENNKGKTKP